MLLRYGECSKHFRAAGAIYAHRYSDRQLLNNYFLTLEELFTGESNNIDKEQTLIVNQDPEINVLAY